MSLRASITNQGNIAIIALEGKMDFESQDILRENITTLMRSGKQVVIDLDKLSFIGSSGITLFIRSMFDLQAKGLTPQFCNAKSEMRQIISAFDEAKEGRIHSSREDAITSFFRSGKDENN